ncbi:hypothetical protein [Flavobacterium agrisoli]|uniref:DUF3325 domain-containing protein n=1 Tax=Flavobacterium agrisoli TaxID=2793066 RepID=A0A934PL89_9FLAO|nr:hypothetical protein [Flavobacterium agrisoli]MBK0369399.1 hypothetical protein [Flavobacterium agrisoli]
MVTIASLLVFIAFYAYYNTSKRAPLHEGTNVEQWLRSKPKQARRIALCFLVLSFTLLLSQKAIGSSSLIFMIQLMTIGSLVVVLAPLKVINPKIIAGVFTLSLFLEFIY